MKLIYLFVCLFVGLFVGFTVDMVGMVDMVVVRDTSTSTSTSTSRTRRLDRHPRHSSHFDY